jgi:signal transduction histidine kinase
MRGRIAGTLFFARKLDFNYIEKMSKLLKYPLKFREMNQNEIANLLEKKQKYSIEKRSKTWMDAYFYYYDIFAESAIEIKIAIRRDINLQAIRSRKIIAVITIFLIFSFCLILYLLFRRLVIREVELRQQKLKVLQTKAIEDKNEELAESNQRATRLNRVLTHDLLTPVQTALLYIETLLGMDFITKDDHQMQYDEQNEIQETLKLVVDQASMQKDIMQHALELDAIESGKREIDLAPVSISKAVQDALKITRPKAEKKGVEIIVIEESNNYFVLADERSLILSVLNNIIGNAIKFSSSGQVIEIEITEINETIVIIDIRDQGIGIPVEMIEHLFVGDKKTSRVGTDGEFGTGFGLPLANSYVCQYGGEIVVESLTEEERDEMSYTTTFSIRLSKTRPNI